jgi:hypothetical protein
VFKSYNFNCDKTFKCVDRQPEDVPVRTKRPSIQPKDSSEGNQIFSYIFDDPVAGNEL